MAFGVLATALAGCGGTYIQPQQSVPLTLSFNGSATGQATVAYSAAVAVSGGTAPYTCSLTTGTLPSGLSLSSSCVINGTPAVAGSSTFTVQAADSSPQPNTGSASFSINVTAAPLAISTTTLSNGAVGIQYAGTIATTGGQAPITCSAGSVPSGLTVNSDCTVTGVPTVAGSYTLAVTAKDSSSTPLTASGSVVLAINATPNTRVLAGVIPVTGASVQIYAAGTSGNGSAPTTLLSAPLTTDGTGGFTLPAASTYTCPSSDAIVYIVVTGGKVGTASPNAVLMTSPGTCASLATTANLVINEPSTVASAYAFAQFMKKGAQIGAASTNLSGITMATATLANLVPPSTGITNAVGVATPQTSVTPQAKINLLADALNACLTSTTGAECTTLYTAATVNGEAPTNTLDAVMNLAQHPGLGTSSLYTLSSKSTAYAPTLIAQPSDWSLFVNYVGGGMNDPSALSIDSQGRVWVANYLSVASLFTNTGVPVPGFENGIVGNSLENSYGAAVDASDNFWISNEEGGPSGLGTITVLTKTGDTAAGSPYTQGGIDFPIGVSIDTNGNAWIANYGDSSVTVLQSDGTPLSGASGYTSSQFVFPVAVAVDGNHNGWLANQSSNTVTKISPDGTSITSYVVGGGPSGVAVDAQNNVWTANYYDDSIGMVSSAGSVVSPGVGFQGGGILHPQGIAIDGAGSVWVANYRGPALSELAGASASSPGAALSPTAGWAPDANLLEAFAVAIDASGNVWVTNFGNNILTEFVGMAVPVKTPLIGVVRTP